MADNVSPDVPTVQSSREEVWYLKDIMFGVGEEKKRYKIITQNFNGPCSFIAICNILILRGQLEILPPDRTTASYEFLSHLVAEFLLFTSSPTIDISAALSALPRTQKGMDLNPLFTGHMLFRPHGTGGELELFRRAGIDLVHGWLVDPHSPEAPSVLKVQDYDSAVDLIANADHITQGQLLVNDKDIPAPGPSTPMKALTDEERTKVEDAIAIRRFLDSSWSQLTHHGLFELVYTLDPGKLVALFRNSHLAVLYKPLGKDLGDASLYSLVTDQAFLHEPTVVWERIEDVDGGSSSYFDADFIRSSPAGGDIIGQTAEDALRAAEFLADPQAQADHALAKQLQYEEDELRRIRRDEYVRRIEENRLWEEQKQDKKRLKKEKSCIIM